MKTRCIPLAAALFAVTTPMLALAQKTSTDTKISDVRVVNDSIRTTVTNEVPVTIQNPVLNVTTEAGKALPTTDTASTARIMNATVTIPPTTLGGVFEPAIAINKRVIVDSVATSIVGSSPITDGSVPYVNIGRGRNGFEPQFMTNLPATARGIDGRWMTPSFPVAIELHSGERLQFVPITNRGQTVLNITYRELDLP